MTPSAKSVYIVNVDGQMVLASYDIEKGYIKSHTLGGVKHLRLWGWDIAKRIVPGYYHCG